MTCNNNTPSFSLSFSTDTRTAGFYGDTRTACFAEITPSGANLDGKLWFDFPQESGHLVTIGL